MRAPQVNAKSFMPLTQCVSLRCQSNRVRGKLFMQTRGSRFVPYQEVRLQELPEHVPVGHIPRSMAVHVRGTNTRKCGPGDIVTITGVFLPMPYTGFRAMRAGLVADTFLEAMDVQRHKKSYSEYEISPGMQDTVRAAHDEGRRAQPARSRAGARVERGRWTSCPRTPTSTPVCHAPSPPRSLGTRT